MEMMKQNKFYYSFYFSVDFIGKNLFSLIRCFIVIWMRFSTLFAVQLWMMDNFRQNILNSLHTKSWWKLIIMIFCWWKYSLYPYTSGWLTRIVIGFLGFGSLKKFRKISTCATPMVSITNVCIIDHHMTRSFKSLAKRRPVASCW